MRRHALKSVMAAVVAGALGLVATGTAAAEGDGQVKERIIRLGHPQTTDHPISLGVRKFAEIVARKSKGALKVQEFPSNQLGSETQQRSALQGGVQEMAVQGPAIAGVVQEFGLLDFPFIVDTEAQADALLDGPFGSALLARLPAKGLIGLGTWEVGFRQVTNNRNPVRTLEDLAGLKIRVQPTEVFIDTFQALKTNPVPLSFSELYSALETRAVDAQENPFLVIRSVKFYEVQKYLSTTNHAYGMVYVVASRKFWDKLSPAEQKILQEAAIEARDYQRRISRDQVRGAIADLQSHGMEITQMPESERDRMRAAVKPVTERLISGYDPELVRLFKSEIARVQQLR